MKYRWHGNLVEARKLTVKDKEGVDYSHDTGSPDGLFYISTTIGKEIFAPGDYLVSTPDGEIVRVRKKEDFEPFAQEVIDVLAKEESGTVEPSSGFGGDLHGKGEPRDSPGDAGKDTPSHEIVGRTENARRRSGAQRSAMVTKRNERRRVSQSKGTKKVHPRASSRTARRRRLTEDKET